MTRTVAFVPARGGSTRIPRKNLQVVGSRSLLDRAIFAGFACDEVVVSTDDDEIASAAVLCVEVGLSSAEEQRRTGALGRVTKAPEIVRRPSELATEHAQIEASIAHWWAKLHEKEKPDAVVLLQPTSPFRTAEHVRQALALLEQGAETVVGVRDVSVPYAFRGRIDPNNGGYYPARSRLARPRSQDVVRLAPMHAENGALYAWTRRHWESVGDRMWGRDGLGPPIIRTEGDWSQVSLRPGTVPLIMSEIESFDVDDQDDLDIARAISAAREI